MIQNVQSIHRQKKDNTWGKVQFVETMFGINLNLVKRKDNIYTNTVYLNTW